MNGSKGGTTTARGAFAGAVVVATGIAIYCGKSFYSSYQEQRIEQRNKRRAQYPEHKLIFKRENSRSDQDSDEEQKMTANHKISKANADDERAFWMELLEIRFKVEHDLQLLSLDLSRSVDDGLLSIRGFCRIQKCLVKNGHSVPSIQRLVDERREAFRCQDWELYRQLVFKMIDFQQMLDDLVLAVVDRWIGFDEGGFCRSHEYAKENHPEEYKELQNKIGQSKISKRKKEAEKLQQRGVSQRCVDRMMPRELSRDEIIEIYYWKQNLSDQFVEVTKETPDEDFFNSQEYLDFLIIDGMQKEFAIEPEDYNTNSELQLLEEADRAFIELEQLMLEFEEWPQDRVEEIVNLNELKAQTPPAG